MVTGDVTIAAEGIGTDRGRPPSENVKRMAEESVGTLGKEMIVMHAGDEGDISAVSETYSMYFTLASHL